MSRFLREPLLHFLLLGAGLFVLYTWWGGPSAGGGERIVITQGKVKQLASGFARMHQRTPDDAELDALIQDAIREEIYYREAKALALDENDTIVRRRLQQKLEFLSEDVAPVPEPSEGELQHFLESHPDKFPGGRRYSIRHVYLNPERRGAALHDDAVRLLAKLQSNDTAGHVGDPFLLESRFDNIGSEELVRLFGADFEARLRSASIGDWNGPVPSAYGSHLIFLRDRVNEKTPPLSAVRASVRAEWIGAKRLEANQRFYADLRKRYSVAIERPSDPGDEPDQVARLLP